MNLYTADQTKSIHDLNFAYLIVQEEDHVLTITLNRPNKKNALNPQMVNELAFAYNYAHYSESVRIIIMQANGTVFCAGGDLKAMAGFIEPHDSDIPETNCEILIGEIFNKVYKPIITIVEGSVYAGGFLLLAGSQYVIARQGLSFGLPEVKRGIYPMQVMASLLKVMPARRVIDWCIRGYNISAQEACNQGLVTHVVEQDAITETKDDIIEAIQQNSPTAIRLGLEAYDKINPSADNHKYLSDMLKKAIDSDDGREGLLAYKEKRAPHWSGK